MLAAKDQGLVGGCLEQHCCHGVAVHHGKAGFGGLNESASVAVPVKGSGDQLTFRGAGQGLNHLVRGCLGLFVRPRGRRGKVTSAVSFVEHGGR